MILALFCLRPGPQASETCVLHPLLRKQPPAAEVEPPPVVAGNHHVTVSHWEGSRHLSPSVCMRLVLRWLGGEVGWWGGGEVGWRGGGEPGWWGGGGSA